MYPIFELLFTIGYIFHKLSGKLKIYKIRPTTPKG